MTAAKRPAPISSHPAFKWGVSAWFALLLGLGLFVMPAEVHRLLAERLGLDAVLTSATAIRAVLSAGAALLGLAIGLVLALRVAALGEASAELDDEPVAAEPDTASPPEADDVWLPDAAPAGEAPARRTNPLRVRAERQGETPEPQGSGPRVEDAPRRPFNPREDLAEEGIAPFEPDAEEPLFEGEAIAEDLAGGIVLHTTEAVPEDPYFAEAWDTPGADGEADPASDDEEEEIVAISFPSEAADAIAIEDEDAFSGAEPDEEEAAVDAPPVAALGDLSLEALTARLESALEAAKPGPPPGTGEDHDPVIAFLRREAERETPGLGSGPHSGDPQAELRSALDKLSRVGKPK